MESSNSSAHPPTMEPGDDVAFRDIVDRSLDVVIVTDATLVRPGPFIRYVNPAFTWLTGWKASEVIGLSPRILQGPGTDRQTTGRIGASLRGGEGVSAKVLNYTKAGIPYWADVRITPLLDRQGGIAGFASFERDVTLEKRRMQELEELTGRDVLTGIPNRQALLQGAEMAFAAFRPGKFCFVWMEVNAFAGLIERLGQPAGDAVIMGVADLLAERVRRADLIGRLGDKEFAICMPGLTLRDALAVANRLGSNIAATTFPTVAGPSRVTCNFGVAVAEQGDTLTTLMARADENCER